MGPAVRRADCARYSEEGQRPPVYLYVLRRVPRGQGQALRGDRARREGAEGPVGRHRGGGVPGAAPPVPGDDRLVDRRAPPCGMDLPEPGQRAGRRRRQTQAAACHVQDPGQRGAPPPLHGRGGEAAQAEGRQRWGAAGAPRGGSKMNDGDRNQFGIRIMVTAEMLGKEMSEPAIVGYWRAPADLTLKQGCEALDGNERDRGGPTPAMIPPGAGPGVPR